MAMDPQELARLTEWTPQQQIEALTTRFPKPFIDENINFTPRPSDMIVAVPPKNGTTWLLHICHQLRMQGVEPDFTEQEDVIGWIEKEGVWFNVDPNTKPQPAEPRLFISHLPYSAVPKGRKLLYCFRDQQDAMMSLYRFMDTIFLLRGRVYLHVFSQFIIMAGAVEKVLQDLLNWWEHRHDDNVMLLFFDDLKEDHVGCVRRIAKFVEIECSESVIERVVHTTTHAEMARHHSKFASRSVVAMFAKRYGETVPTEFVGRVRKGGGTSGEGQKLPTELQDHIKAKWNEIITAKLGFKNLTEMRDAWHKEI